MVKTAASTITKTLPKDLLAGLVVYLVALPLCLGVAVASNAPPIAGLLAGILGGCVIGLLSGSQTSVSGPAAGLTAVVAMQIAKLGTFEAFLVALVLAGALQVILGVLRAGFIASFFPQSVIKGLLAAIGVILILKQLPHLVGYDADPMGEKSFLQPDGHNTFSQIYYTLSQVHPGAAVIGFLSIAVIAIWDRVKALKNSPIPSALVVVVLGVVVGILYEKFGWGCCVIGSKHMVDVPVTSGPLDFAAKAFVFPDWNILSNPSVYMAALTVAVVASLETLLNLEAVDKIDPKQRVSPPNRELVAQGLGNMLAGFIGGLPMTSVIIRSSVNINAKAETKLSAVWHGLLILGCVMFIPGLLNIIPLSCLAAILLMTGLKLASPKLFKQLWKEGYTQFVPFFVTVVAIVLTDLLVGVMIGLGVAICFMLYYNAKRPVRQLLEKHVSGEVLHVVLANQVSFLSRASLEKSLRSQKRGGHVLLDATHTDYIDPDVLDFLADFKESTAPALGIHLSLKGFKSKYSELQDVVQYVDFTNQELQSELTPERVLKVLRDGHQRFIEGRRLPRDIGRLVDLSASGQYPMAAVLSCIDSRTPAEMIFDLGLGDIFSVRIAGNVAKDKVLASLEYSCAVAGAKLIVVMGHTNCGAVNAAIDLCGCGRSAKDVTGCEHLDVLIEEIQKSFDPQLVKPKGSWAEGERERFAKEVSKMNMLRTMQTLRENSKTIDELVKDGKIAIVGCMYDLATGQVDFYQTSQSSELGLPEDLAKRI